MTIQVDQRNEEKETLEKERIAFERLQAALFAVNSQFVSEGNLAPTDKSIDELEVAQNEWHKTRAEVDRIVEEIRSGKRQ